MLKIKLKKLRESVKLPQKMTGNSAGYDIYANIKGEMIVKPKEVVLVPTGFALEIPSGYEAQIRPRSGLAVKHKIGVLNSPGTIDADYRGEVKIILINLGNEDFIIEKNRRIAQMVFSQVPDTVLVETESLSVTKRNRGGFGHTDKFK